MDTLDRIARNPFYVLGVHATCTRVEMEREAHKLLGMLELGIAAAGFYDSPVGRHPRTADAVRAAAAQLRDPERRLAHELWLAPPRLARGGDEQAEDADASREWVAAFEAMGVSR